MCVCLHAHVCVISSWVAGCRQPGRDKRGWMEGALRVCVSNVCACVLVYVRLGKSLHKSLEVCVLLSTSAGLGGDKQTAKYSPCVFPAKTGGGIPTTQTDATGQAWNEPRFHSLQAAPRKTRCLCTLTTGWVDDKDTTNNYWHYWLICCLFSQWNH